MGRTSCGSTPVASPSTNVARVGRPDAGRVTHGTGFIDTRQPGARPLRQVPSRTPCPLCRRRFLFRVRESGADRTARSRRGGQPHPATKVRCRDATGQFSRGFAGRVHMRFTRHSLPRGLSAGIQSRGRRSPVRRLRGRACGPPRHPRRGAVWKSTHVLQPACCKKNQIIFGNVSKPRAEGERRKVLDLFFASMQKPFSAFKKPTRASIASEEKYHQKNICRAQR